MAAAVAEYANLTYPHRSLKALQKLRDKAGSSSRAPASTSRTVYRIDRRLGSEKVAAIITAYKNGATARSIATEHNVSHTALVQLLRDAGVPIRRQPLTGVQIQQARDLRAQGLSIAKTATELGLARESIRRALLR
jgi:DNA invertase Pin-like site-specific DNA recombinase